MNTRDKQGGAGSHLRDTFRGTGRPEDQVQTASGPGVDPSLKQLGSLLRIHGSGGDDADRRPGRSPFRSRRDPKGPFTGQSSPPKVLGDGEPSGETVEGDGDNVRTSTVSTQSESTQFRTLLEAGENRRKCCGENRRNCCGENQRNCALRGSKRGLQALPRGAPS